MKKIFIDCGGHDGCSVMKFLSMRPEYLCHSFEPNPVFLPYYKWLPSKLEPAAVTTFDGFVELIVDPVDGDGSTIKADKRADFTGQVPNSECPILRVRSIDISRFVMEVSKSYDVVVLKLDVEGAEYEILEKMLMDGSLRKVDELYCEFHWDRMEIGQEEHSELLGRIGKVTRLSAWDAADFAVHGKDRKARVGRWVAIVRLWSAHLFCVLRVRLFGH